MAEDDIIEFIQKKDKFIEEEDYKIRIFFKLVFYDASETAYHEQTELLDKRIQLPTSSPRKMKKFLNTDPCRKATRKGSVAFGVSSLSSFLPHQHFHFTTEAGNASREVKEKNFFEAFEHLVSNKELIPDKSVILLTQDKHQMARVKPKVLPLPPSAKKLKANAKGSKLITNYFTVAKSSSEGTAKKAPSPPKPMFKYKVEEVVYNLRSDKVKILWIPANHSELNPWSYISIMLKSEICNFLTDNKEETTASAIKENFSKFPNDVWCEITRRVKYFESVYLERNGDHEFDEDEAESTTDESVCNENQATAAN